MKKNIISLVLFLATTPLFAHYIWIETAPVGKQHTEHFIKVRFGEYTYGVLEKTDGDAFKSVSKFTLWVMSPSGKKTPLKVSAKEDFYAASFIPTEDGTYTIALDNKNIKVLDYTKYDYGIFKGQYHAKAKVVVGNTLSNFNKTNTTGIEIIDLTDQEFSKESTVLLQVLFNGEPLKENELSVFVADLWSKKLKTDKEGKVTFKLPWETKYIVETIFEEKVPGTFKGLDYDFIWHCATYCISLKSK
ncbi:DUF4198 domain-containing protein [Polaribacter cellanae]|uniref:DUF4198 domain-containing protein n=1 Tax=Polaribacter cellanae TaxID=2818493 RepID=A0A975CQ18_9FLAO|nr:DUF4198 domain-containing protein [Polaribacter cellanae]QTE22610.1 DUF4198 domain-containing protein [Polaribacter cellanae]